TSAQCQRPVVCLEHVAIISIIGRENASVAFAKGSVHARPCGINDLHIQVLHSLYLEYTLGWTGGQQREIRAGATARKLNSIQTAADVCKTEVPDEPVRNAIPHERSNNPLWIELESVSEFESSDPESGRLISAESLKTDESLLYKDA